MPSQLNPAAPEWTPAHTTYATNYSSPAQTLDDTASTSPTSLSYDAQPFAPSENQAFPPYHEFPHYQHYAPLEPYYHDYNHPQPGLYVPAAWEPVNYYAPNHAQHHEEYLDDAGSPFVQQVGQVGSVLGGGYVDEPEQYETGLGHGREAQGGNGASRKNKGKKNNYSNYNNNKDNKYNNKKKGKKAPKARKDSGAEGKREVVRT